MKTILTFVKSTRWFFVSAIIIFFIAIGLGQIDVGNSKDMHSALSLLAGFVESHQYAWIIVRFVIILLFFLVWPVMVNRWSIQYGWPAAYAKEVRERRWRYVAWFVVIDLTFQLL